MRVDESASYLPSILTSAPTLRSSASEQQPSITPVTGIFHSHLNRVELVYPGPLFLKNQQPNSTHPHLLVGRTASYRMLIDCNSAFEAQQVLTFAYNTLTNQ